MLKRVAKGTGTRAGKASIVIVASKYNARYVDGMLRPARAILMKAQAGVRVVRVPGAFEIPVVAAKLASSQPGLTALICLGVVLRGETTHAQHIVESVSAAFAQIQVTYHIPVIHEVLLLENAAQAEVRCLSPEHNRGAEAAHTALEMSRTMRLLGRGIPSVK